MKLQPTTCRWRTRSAWFGRSLTGVLLLAWALAPLAASGQAFRIQGGSSSIFGGHGGSLEVRGPSYTARFGFGFLDEPRFGFLLIKPYRGLLWNAGDQAVPFNLPTDQVSSNYYFLARGLGASWKQGRHSLFVFGGATSRGFSLPFFTAGQASTGTGLIFFEERITSTLHFFSHNVLGPQQTSIQSIEWTPRKDFKASLSGGLGSNQPYGAAAVNFRRKWIAVEAGYGYAGSGFRRVRSESPSATETERENIRVELHPRENLSFTISRNHYLTPEQDGPGEARAAVNNFNASWSVAGMQFHGSFYDSRNPSGASRAISLGARRRFGNRVDTSVDYMRSMPSQGPATGIVVTNLREQISNRITLSQVISHGNGQTTVSFGGNFFSNRFSVGVEYQTVYIPFATGNSTPFKQVLLLSLRLQLPQGLELNAASDVTPLGRVRYTAYGTGYAYRGVSAGGTSYNSGGSFYANLVQGVVEEENGTPVGGAALRINNELVFTDSQGRFMLRLKHANEVPFSVALDEFSHAGNWAVVSAPRTVKPAKEASDVHVVLRRQRTKALVLAESAPAGSVGAPDASAWRNAPLPHVVVSELGAAISTGSSLSSSAPMEYKGADASRGYSAISPARKADAASLRSAGVAAAASGKRSARSQRGRRGDAGGAHSGDANTASADGAGAGASTGGVRKGEPAWKRSRAGRPLSLREWAELLRPREPAQSEPAPHR